MTNVADAKFFEYDENGRLQAFSGDGIFIGYHTAEQCPICPRCRSKMIKVFFEAHDHSGFLVAWSCSCYKHDPIPNIRTEIR